MAIHWFFLNKHVFCQGFTTVFFLSIPKGTLKVIQRAECSLQREFESAESKLNKEYVRGLSQESGGIESGSGLTAHGLMQTAHHITLYVNT